METFAHTFTQMDFNLEIFFSFERIRIYRKELIMCEQFKCENGHFIMHDNVMYKTIFNETISFGDLVWNNDDDVFEIDEDDDLDFVNGYYFKVKKL